MSDNSASSDDEFERNKSINNILETDSEFRNNENGGTMYSRQMTDNDPELEIKRSESNTRFESLNLKNSQSPTFKHKHQPNFYNVSINAKITEESIDES